MRIKSGLFGILWLLLLSSAICAETIQLGKADSLFSAQKYTEAFVIYEDILKLDQASPSMLLKMAFIQDASGNYTDALYYLDLYYQISADRFAVGKIEEIASEFQLSGYQYNDLHYFNALYGKYKLHIILLLLSLSVLLLAYIARKSRIGEKAYIASVFQFAAIILVVWATNVQTSRTGIIMDDLTLLRSGPSAGAEPIEVVTKGHKVKVVSQSEIWTKVLWNGNEVFVRSNRLKLI